MRWELRVCAVCASAVATAAKSERWLALEDEDDNGGDAEKEEEEDLTDIEFDDEPLEEIYDIF